MVDFNKDGRPFKGLLHPKMKIVINHLSPCRSKPVKASFITRILFVRKENKNNHFVQQFVSSQIVE